VRANGSNCWNWFEPAQQERAGEEPSVLAGIIGDIGHHHPVQAGRVFVAGLSAGAAMAVILGRTYPELFAGVAAHSGLPVGAASDVSSAFAAMQGRGAAQDRAGHGGPGVRTIVFHGDADATVTSPNGEAIVTQAVDAYARSGAPLRKQTRLDAVVGGRRCTTTEFTGSSGESTMVEAWTVHGGAHAWYGGSPAGSFTDAAGPDASSEIVRFFLGQPR
ncbi:MAG: PHB depolymerase family esterase, partial [Rubrivivax sp.]